MGLCIFCPGADGGGCCQNVSVDECYGCFRFEAIESLNGVDEGERKAIKMARVVMWAL